MGRRSFFFKNYVTHLVLIVCAFTVAGGVFYYQMSNYALASKQAELRTTVQSLAEQTKLMQGTDSDVIRQIFMLSIARVAKEDTITVCVTDADGVIQMAADTSGTVVEYSRQYAMPASAVAQVRETGSYAEVGQLGVIGDRSSYTVGTGVMDDNGEITAMVFINTQDAAAAGTVRHSTQTLVLILVVTLAVALIISFILSQHMTRPLKVIAAAAKEFAAGNFEVRVPEDNHCYEIDELAVSFNNMARDLDQLEELTRGFISNVSHEFKTPMTTIGGFVDGMIDGTIPPDQRDKYLHIIAEETRRLSRMVNRMLDAAKIQSGELILNPAPMDFSEMTTQILLSFEQKIEKKQLTVECDLDLPEVNPHFIHYITILVNMFTSDMSGAELGRFMETLSKRILLMIAAQFLYFSVLEDVNQMGKPEKSFLLFAVGSKLMQLRCGDSMAFYIHLSLEGTKLRPGNNASLPLWKQ